jgi:hypothetical protein
LSVAGELLQELSKLGQDRSIVHKEAKSNGT